MTARTQAWTGMLAAMILMAVAIASPATAGVPPRPPPHDGINCIAANTVPGPAMIDIRRGQLPANARLTGGTGVAVSEWRPNWWEVQSACSLLVRLLYCLGSAAKCVDPEGVPEPELSFWDGMGATYDGSTTVQVALIESPGKMPEYYEMTADEYLEWYGYT